MTSGGLEMKQNVNIPGVRKNPLIERRLDYFLVSNNLQEKIKKGNIINAISTDHLAVNLYLLSPSRLCPGPSHWRKNTLLLENEE